MSDLERIANAVRAAKFLGDKNAELHNIIKYARNDARRIEELDIPAELTEEINLQYELKQKLQNMWNYCSEVSFQYKELCDEIKNFEAFLTAKFQDSTISAEVIKEFCEQQKIICNLAKNFNDRFKKLVRFLSNSQLLAEKLTNKLKQRFYEAERAADSSKKKGFAGAVGLTGLGTALGILGFFTGGATWAAAGAVTGAAAIGAGAGAAAHNSVVNVRALRQLADDIRGCSDELDVIAKHLESRVEKAFHLDEEMTAALETLLAFSIRDQ